MNYALLRPAVQSSTRWNAEASLAVDGDLTTVSCTEALTEQWFAVDLGAPLHVGRVCVLKGHYTQTYLPIDQDGTVAERVVRSVMVDDTVVLAGQFMAGLTNENPAVTTPVHVQYSDALPLMRILRSRLQSMFSTVTLCH